MDESMRSRFAELRSGLVALAGAGLSLRDACTQAEVPEATARGWLRKGREGTEPYDGFVREMEAAREAAQVAHARLAPMNEAELLEVASGAARKGSVQAMRLVWEMLRTEPADGEREKPADTLGFIDQLAQRRAGKTRGVDLGGAG